MIKTYIPSILSAGIFLLAISAFPTISYAADISLKTVTPQIKTGQEAQIDVFLSGGEETLGTDIVIMYDPKTMEMTKVSEGSLYPTYLPPISNRIDKEKGKIILSGSANLTQPVAANGVFASVFFKPLKEGEAKVSLDYAEGATNKTVILSFSGENLLKSAPTELKLVFSSGNLLQTILDGILAPFKLFFNKMFGNK